MSEQLSFDFGPEFEPQQLELPLEEADDRSDEDPERN